MHIGIHGTQSVVLDAKTERFRGNDIKLTLSRRTDDLGLTELEVKGILMASYFSIAYATSGWLGEEKPKVSGAFVRVTEYSKGILNAVKIAENKIKKEAEKMFVEMTEYYKAKAPAEIEKNNAKLNFLFPEMRA